MVFIIKGYYLLIIECDLSAVAFGKTCPLLFTMQRYNTCKLFARKMRDIFRPFQVGKKCRQNGENLCGRAFDARSEIGRKVYENWAFGRFLDEPSGRAERTVFDIFPDVVDRRFPE